MEDKARPWVRKSHLLQALGRRSQPVFVADAVGNGYVGKVTHDGFGRRIHEVQRSLVVWLLKAIFRTEPARRFSSRRPPAGMGKHLLGKAPSVDPHNNPGVGQQDIGLLKLLYIFVPGAHGRSVVLPSGRHTWNGSL